MSAIETVKNVATTSYQQTVAAAKNVQPVEAQTAEMATAQAMQTPVVQKVSQKNDGGMQGGYENENTPERQVAQDNEKIKNAVADLNKKMDKTVCQYGIHEGTGRVTIKILNKETKEVIKEYPAEETLDMIQKVWELAGLMVDQKL